MNMYYVKRCMDKTVITKFQLQLFSVLSTCVIITSAVVTRLRV